MQIFINIVATKLKTKVSYLLSQSNLREAAWFVVHALFEGREKVFKRRLKSKEEEDSERDTNLREDWWGIVL